MTPAAMRFPIPAASAEQPYCTELVVRRSRFMAQCAHTPDAGSAKAFIEATGRCRNDADHNCWAYAAGAPGDTAHIGSSDDGEPHGTAGRPMLSVLLHCGIGELCVVVSRWFGGVKLGTGGLVRTYQDAVRENLANLALAERIPSQQVAVTLKYAHLAGMHRLLPLWEARIMEQSCEDAAKLRIELPQAHVQNFEQALANMSNGTAVFHRTGGEVYGKI